MAYVYTHIRMDTYQVFYVGIGSKKSRLNSKKSRNKYWHSIVNKYGMSAQIIEDNLSWEKACECEKYWISYYGRENLCNMTDGGEGTYGRVVSSETRNKISISHKGKKLGPEHVRKISEGNKGKTKPKPDGFGDVIRKIVQGTKRTDESKKKQSITTKETLSKIREKLSERSKGVKNSNSVRYVLLNTVSYEVVEIDGYKSVLEYFNKLTNSNKKDAMFLIRKIKENQIEELKFIYSIKINSI